MTGAAGRPATILLVEDNAAIRRAYTAALEGVGHRVLAAENGAAALDLVRTERPDLILQDLGVSPRKRMSPPKPSVGAPTAV